MSISVASVLDLDIWLQPKQELLWELVDESPYSDIGFGGRRGGGKSGGVRRIMLLRRLKYAGTDGILLRRTRQELVDNHLIPLFREYPMLRDFWLEKDRALVLPNDSRLLFRYAEHAVDVERLFGVEYADIGVEEAGLFSKPELEKMRGSNRWSRSPITPKMLYSFMPGGRSHFYLKEAFVDNAIDKDAFTFIEAYGWDNVEHCRAALIADGLTDRDYYSWTDAERKAYYFARADYAKKLQRITDPLLRACWLDGNWNDFEGIVFPELSDSLHNLDNFVTEFRPRNHRLVSAIDWADSGITGMEQAAIDSDENTFFFDEYHERNLTVVEHAATITRELNENGHQDYTLMDLPVNNINQADLFSIQDAFRRAGLHTIQAHRANIAIGLDLLRQFLAVDPNRIHPFTNELGSPRLFISRRKCPHLWRQMAELQRMVDAETGKVKYVGEDDNLDPARYIAMSRPRAPEKIKQAPSNLPAYSHERKAAASFARFDKTFGKDPDQNNWFPKP